MEKDVRNYLNYILNIIYSNRNKKDFLKFEEMFEYECELGTMIYELAILTSKK